MQTVTYLRFMANHKRKEGFDEGLPSGNIHHWHSKREQPRLKI